MMQETPNRPILRFAPSPNGELHLGHALSALTNMKIARALNAKMLLRIEDIDTTRCTPELETQMLKDLEWIGFEWDEQPRHQSEHFDEYSNALEELNELELLFPSVISRGQIKSILKEKERTEENWPSDPDGAPLYPGDEHLDDDVLKTELINSGEPYALRFDIAKSKVKTEQQWTEFDIAQSNKKVFGDAAQWGKPVLGRKDTPASYHLCCVIDDALQDVTHVVRGKDLYHATSIHRLLQETLKLPEPLYHHHPLILDETGKKLSKSDGDTSIAALREQGLTKNQILEDFHSKGLI